MRTKKLLPFLTCLLGLVLAAQLAGAAGHQVPRTALGQAVLRGHIAHATARTVSVLYGATWQGSFAHTITAPVSATGDFRLLVPAPAEGVLQYGERYVQFTLAAGNDVQLSFDATRPDQKLLFKGVGANANTYLNQAFRQSNQDDEAGRTPSAQAPTVRAADMRRLAAAYREHRRAALAAFVKAHPLPAVFVQQQCQALDYEWAAALLAYPAAQSKARQQSGVTALPPGYFDFLPTLHLSQHAAAVGQPAFQGLLTAYIAGVLRPLADSLPQ
ncbi:MAG: hypothetical protein ACRYG7_54465, partial [Janthinobacterium lividum]